MTGHLSTEILTALSDGELQTGELAAVQKHLTACAACTSEALAHSLIKSATSRVGQRYAIPQDLAERVSSQLAAAGESAQTVAPTNMPSPRSTASTLRKSGWAIAASLLAVAALSSTWFLAQHDSQAKMAQTAAANALVSEVFDQHVAALAASSPPQVLSSDNHTVKPWFQGKLPFAFNLPETLPTGMTLDGANLVYLRDQPAAQLLFSIGRHRVSVFVTKRAPGSADLPPDHAGFHVMSFSSGNLEGIAVSDVNPGRLAELVRALEGAQNPSSL